MATTATVAVTTVGPPSALSHSSEEEIAKKKNTDCVYFLASPLTCKKGDECEFRHSESARLNPRECWYWVGGNCRNRECPFRHPPLESRATAPAAAAPQPTTPTQQKKPVPCFFFSQGCCTKGNKCHFLHENPTSNAMVYRLSDSSKSAAHDAASKTKIESSAVPADTAPQQQSSTTTQAPDKRKENVYRLDDSKKPKATGPSRESSEDMNSDQFRRHKESFTWKLSDSPGAQKQAAQVSEAREKKSEKQSRMPSSSSASEPDRKRRESSASRNSDRGMVLGDGIEVTEDFAGPKSLAQIKQEKRKSGDSEEFASSKRKACSDQQSSDLRSESVRRKLCNGSSKEDDGGGRGAAINGGDVLSVAADADDRHADEDDTVML